MEYRLAKVDDLADLVKTRLDFLIDAGNIKNESEKEPLLAANTDFFRSGLADKTFVAWLAVDAGKIAATSGVSFYSLPPSTFQPTGQVAYISNMFTYPQYRKQGIATKLFALTVEEAKKRGCKKIMLNATEMGRPIYEKYGFRDANHEMVFFVPCDTGSV